MDNHNNPMMNQTRRELTKAQFLAIKEYVKTRLDERDFHGALPSDDRLKMYISSMVCDPTNKNELENVAGTIYYRLESRFGDPMMNQTHKNTESE